MPLLLWGYREKSGDTGEDTGRRSIISGTLTQQPLGGGTPWSGTDW